MLSPRLQHHLNSSTLSIEVGSALATGWRFLVPGIGQFILYGLVYFMISGVINLIPFINFLASLLISPILMAGYYIFTDDIRAGRPLQFERFFAGFRKFGPLVLSNLVAAAASIMLLGVGVLIAFGPTLFGQLETLQRNPDAVKDMLISMNFGMVFLIMLLPTILTFLFQYCNAFAMIGIVSLNLDFSDAWAVAFRIVIRNILPLILFSLLCLLVIIAGILALFLGLLVAFPLIYTMTYSLYYHAVIKHVQGAEEHPTEPILQG